MRNKKLIISLIQDDLVSYKLVLGLNELGLNASDYFLNLSDTIFKLMKFSDSKAEEKIYEHYLELTKRVKYIDITESRNTLNSLAHEIYVELTKLKSKL
jgi:hypothetical protein